MDDDLRIAPGLTIPLREVELRFSRSGGPGGQNVNVRDTRVEAVFDVVGSPSLVEPDRRRILAQLAPRIDAPGRLRVVASEARTQAGNRRLALERLRDLLAEALRPDAPPRRPTRPGRGAVEQRLATKRLRSRRKRERSLPPED